MARSRCELPGRPDADFAQPGVPLTKEEIRVVSLAKLRLRRGQALYDIGAGTGAVAIEAATFLAPGPVWAFERDPERCLLLSERLAGAGLPNLQLVCGETPEAWAGLPPPDNIFVGGSGGRLEAILRGAAELLPSGGRLVLNAVTVESLSLGLKLLQEFGWEEEVVSLQVARGERVGESHILRSHNPIFILRGLKP